MKLEFRKSVLALPLIGSLIGQVAGCSEREELHVANVQKGTSNEIKALEKWTDDLGVKYLNSVCTDRGCTVKFDTNDGAVCFTYLTCNKQNNGELGCFQGNTTYFTPFITCSTKLENKVK